MTAKGFMSKKKDLTSRNSHAEIYPGVNQRRLGPVLLSVKSILMSLNLLKKIVSVLVDRSL